MSLKMQALGFSSKLQQRIVWSAHSLQMLTENTREFYILDFHPIVIIYVIQIQTKFRVVVLTILIWFIDQQS
jgi:hypothetical protein